MVEITLRVTGVDLDSESTEDILAECFPETLWETVEGMVTVTAFVGSESPVAETVDIARRLEQKLKGMRVLGVHRDLVGTSDVALRAGVSREGARKWTLANDFPAPYDYIGASSMKVWTWTEVCAWLNATRSLDLDDDLPSVELMAQIDNCLMRNPDHTTVQWHQATTRMVSAPPKFQTVKSAVRVGAGGRAQRVATAVCGPVGAVAQP